MDELLPAASSVGVIEPIMYLRPFEHNQRDWNAYRNATVRDFLPCSSVMLYCRLTTDPSKISHICFKA